MIFHDDKKIHFLGDKPAGDCGLLLGPKINVMKYLLLLTISLGMYTFGHARSWRVNNNIGVQADFTTFFEAVQSASVLAGDTLYFEPSATVYNTNSITVTKRLVMLGVGYLLNPTNPSMQGNAGLQETRESSQIGFFRLGNGANGSYFAGLSFASISLTGSASNFNLTFERNLFGSTFNFEAGSNSGVILKKNIFYNAGIANNTGATIIVSDFTCENNIFYEFWGGINLSQLTGNNNIFRNNSIYRSATGMTLVNCYVANNIFGCNGAVTLTNSTVKNNLFQTAQVLPSTATNNLVSQNMETVYGPHNNALSADANVMIPAGSPATGAGLTVGTVVSPDCGAFGATDPYKLSGIPAIPTIYSLTVPTSIPSGTATMNITLSTRNNN